MLARNLMMFKSAVTRSTRITQVGKQAWHSAYKFALWLPILVIFDIVAVGLLKAYYKPLWLDEIMGVLIAKLSFGQIIAMCKAGTDNQPLAYHFAMHETVRLFASDALGTRIPSLIGYATFTVCLYVFVSRRAGRIWGVVAMLFPLLTRAWYYATEGRPYAIMLGLAGIAAVCWQSLATGRRRLLSLAGLALSLLCAVNMHYFALLVFIPFWMGEGVRTFIRREIDWPVWLCISLPLSGLLLYIPIIQVAKVNTGIPFAAFARPSIFTFAKDFFAPTLTALLCAAIVYFIFLYLRPQFEPAVRHDIPDPRFAPEAAAVVGFAAIPFVAVVLARFGTHIFFSRYGIAGVFGFSALAGLCGWLAFERRTAPGWILVLVFCALIVHDQKTMDLSVIRGGYVTPARVAMLRRLPGAARTDGVPIVPLNLDDFMQFFYYGDSQVRRRLFYVADEELAYRYLGFTFHERMMLGSAGFFQTQVVPYKAFLRQHKDFYVFGTLEFSSWLVPALQASGVRLQVVRGGPLDAFGAFYDTCLRASVPDRQSQ